MLFSEILLAWYEENRRLMPWRGENDPYKIWISEIILQQTRINQGWNYYIRFIENFPDIASLAQASPERVLKVWQGLGYYSRARNLHKAAQTVMKEHQGVFPKNYDDILKLKGIGEYTAAAIASIAFNLPYPVVDGNVFRIISRIFGIYEDISLPATKKIITAKCTQLMDKEKPSDFNQAIMDFGAIQCKPQNPDCETCPLKKHCFAFIHQTVHNLPVKTRNIKLRTRYFHYLIFSKEEQIMIRKRVDNDIWKNLYDFPLLESNNSKSEELISILTKFKASKKPHWRCKHKLTHQIIIADFYMIPVNKFPGYFENCTIISKKNAVNYPSPKIIAQILSFL